MKAEEIKRLLDEVKEEFRIFERPSADNSFKMFQLLQEQQSVIPEQISDEDIEKCVPYKEPIGQYQLGKNVGFIRGAKALRDGKIKGTKPESELVKKYEELRIKKEVQLRFKICSDTSTLCLGYRNLCKDIERLESEIAELKARDKQ